MQVDEDLGRWADPSLLVMTSLAAGPKHGYAIMQDVAEESGVRLGPGTLYGAIARLEERGLIEPLRATDRRRPYRITAEGSRVLAAQLERMRGVADTGLRRLAGTRAAWSGAAPALRRAAAPFRPASLGKRVPPVLPASLGKRVPPGISATDRAAVRGMA